MDRFSFVEPLSAPNLTRQSFTGPWKGSTSDEETAELDQETEAIHPLRTDEPETCESETYPRSVQVTCGDTRNRDRRSDARPIVIINNNRAVS